jgi:hypothetical protein
MATYKVFLASTRASNTVVCDDVDCSQNLVFDFWREGKPREPDRVTVFAVPVAGVLYVERVSD